MATTHTKLLYHVVFSTKHRKKLIVPRFREDLFSYIGGIMRREGSALLEAGGIRDHIHLLFGIPPTISLSDMMRVIKAKTSRWLNENHIRKTKFRWQKGYGGFTVSESMLPEVKEYIQNQEKHHQNRSFEEELKMILEKHGIDFEESYLFEQP